MVVSPSRLDLQVGEVSQLSAAVSGDAGTTFVWTSSDAGVAAVTSTGRVSAMGPGSAVITVHPTGRPERAASVQVAVRAPVAVAISPESLEITVGQSGQLAATVTNASDTRVTWESSSPGTATVDGSGSVTAIAVGIATVTARSVADPSRVATATVQVRAPQAAVLTSGQPVTGVSGAEGSERYWRIDVPAQTARLRVTLRGGSGDVDLFLRRGSLPDDANFDCSSEGAATDETCEISSPAAGEWFVRLYGFEAYSGVTLLAETPEAGFRLIMSAVGQGQGTIEPSPEVVTYKAGDRVTVRPEPHMYSEFRGWDSGPCAGFIGNCIVTFSDADIVMVPRFEFTKWVGPLSVQYTANLDAANSNNGSGCSWNVTWTDARLEITHARSGSGWVRRSRVTGTSTAVAAAPNCTGTSSTMDRTFEEPASGLQVSSTFSATQTALAGQVVTYAIDLNPWPAGSLGTYQVDYLGTGRSGGMPSRLLVMQVTR